MPETATKPRRRRRRTAKLSKPGPREIRVERIFEAPREKVWRAFSSPDIISRWWGRGNQLEIEKHELQRGGHWRFVEHAPEGAVGFEGRFRDIEPLEKISQSFEWDDEPSVPSYQTTTFEDTDEGATRVVTSLQFYTKEQRDGMIKVGMKDGLNKGYKALDKILMKME